MAHHTKEKGDLGVAAATKDLIKNGFSIFSSNSEHLPYDLIAVNNETGKMYKIQVKYRTPKKGVITLGLRTIHSSKKGIHTKYYTKFDFHILAVYDSDKDCMYYLDNSWIGRSKSINIRTYPTLNKQKKKVLDCSLFTLETTLNILGDSYAD